MGGENIAKSVGITKDVHVHSLRHTYATHLLRRHGYYRSKTFWATKQTTLEYLQSPARVNKNSAHLTHFLRNAAPSSRCTESLEKIETIGLNTWQLRTLSAIKRCRTANWVGHIDACDECGSP
jgi:hypothetical protein